MNKQPYKIGQTVFVVDASPYAQTEIACPVCYGKLSVTLILGNGEHQDIECDYCSRGYHGPSGTVMDRAPHSSVAEKAVTGISHDQYGDRWRVECDGFTEDPANIFINAEMAEAYRARRHLEVEKTAADMNTDRRSHGGKTLPWSVGYARREIKDCERRIAHHKAKLSAHKKEKE